MVSRQSRSVEPRRQALAPAGAGAGFFSFGSSGLMLKFGTSRMLVGRYSHGPAPRRSSCIFRAAGRHRSAAQSPGLGARAQQRRVLRMLRWQMLLAEHRSRIGAGQSCPAGAAELTRRADSPGRLRASGIGWWTAFEHNQALLRTRPGTRSEPGRSLWSVFPCRATLTCPTGRPFGNTRSSPEV